MNRNLFGGSIGGPIIPDRAFFFYTYERRIDAKATSVLRAVPLASMGRGELKFPEVQADGSTITRTLTLSQLNSLYPDVGMNPAAIAIFADAARKYTANSTEEGDGLNFGGYRFNAPQPLRWNTNIVKIDFNLNDKHNLFIRGNYQLDNIGREQQFPDTPTTNVWHHPYGFAVGHTWTANSRLINKINYGLTRLSFSDQGDSNQNRVNFRFVFEPLAFSRTLNRTNPVHNITDDLTWVRGNHTFQFGTNIRLVRNNRTNFSTSYDQAILNPSFYDASGAVLSDPIVDSYEGTGKSVDPGFISPLRTVMSSLIGRFSQYTANFNFDKDGSILPSGTGISRTFATEQYDWYAQDSWRIGKSLTLNAGLRYGLNSPVYEANGLQVKPTVPLGEYFERRKRSSELGIPYFTPVEIDLAGPANNQPGYYPWDVNNFQPRFSAAWSPDFKNRFFKKLFGEYGKSVIRGGFAMTHDQIGQQLAVFFDTVNTLGFSSSYRTSANTFDVTSNPGPLFTKFNPNVRTLPGVTIPANLRFPLTTPSDGEQRIESSLDESLITPANYSWSVSLSRELPLGITVEGSYIGRLGRNLLATRDVMALNNLVDPKSGMDWYTAATQLVKLFPQNNPLSAIKPVAYFENLFPGLAGDGLTSTQVVYDMLSSIRDYTFVQLLIDDAGIFPNAFFHPQYGALETFSTIAYSDYHAATFTVRQRLRNHLYLDFNYSLSKSTDNASGLQTDGGFGASFIHNSLRPDDNQAASGFDVRHVINSSAVWDMSFGRGKKFLTNIPGVANVLLGGWQLSSIFRWNSGLPATSCCIDKAFWATNWNAQTNVTRTKPLESSPDKKTANLFSDTLAAYKSFRNAYPGETGERNVFRLPGYISLDIGLSKSFTMPWSESHKVEFRWDVFNATNTQKLGEILSSRDGVGIDIDPETSAPPSTFGNFIGIQGEPRTMQFALRYKF